MAVAERVTAPPCESCEGTPGWRFVTVAGVRRAFRCDDCFRPAYLTAPGVPKEFEDATLDNFRAIPGNTNALAAVSKWLKDGTRDLFIQGDVGRGKSRLAASALNEHFRAHHAGRFLQTVTLLREIQLSFRDEPTDAERRAHHALMRSLETESLLVLDDLGVEKASDFSRRELFMVYEARHNKGLRTIWTSNFDIEWIDDANGFDDKRLASRIAGRAVIVELTCGDWRAPGTREVKD